MGADLQALHELPDNRYARQLRQGFPWLRFTPSLESDYRRYISESQIRYQKGAILLALAIWLLFALVDVQRLQLQQHFPDYRFNIWMVLLVRGSMLLILAALAVLLRSGHLDGHGAKVAVGVLFSLGVSTASLVILYRLEGVALSDSVLLLIIIAVFFPLGLSFGASVALALGISLVMGLIGWALLWGEAREEYVRLARMLLLAVMVGAVGGYFREHAQREQFLLRHLLGWQANHDPLTGLHNRRSFSRHLDVTLRQAQREGVGAALVVIDVDHFKLFNDHYGHQAGDRALQGVAQVLLGFVRRPLDMAVRLGGEEFALLLYATSAERLGERVATLPAALAALDIAHAASPTARHLSASIGATLALPAECGESLYQRADGLLYQAKQAGRNRVVLG